MTATRSGSLSKSCLCTVYRSCIDGVDLFPITDKVTEKEAFLNLRCSCISSKLIANDPVSTTRNSSTTKTKPTVLDENETYSF